MLQKVIKIGSSIGVVIPKPLAKDKHIEPGKEINIKGEDGSNRIIIELVEQKSPAKGNPDLVAWAEEAVERYRPALEALKNK